MFNLIVFAILLTLGYFVGTYLEKSHYKLIKKKERRFRNILVFETRTLPDEHIDGGHLVSGNVVISTDYFKMFVAGLRMLIGGRLRSYETLLDRARREAVLRMKQDAIENGANAIFNVKFETASISQGVSRALGSVEVLVYGSAISLDTANNR